MDESSPFLHSRQVKQVLCQALPAALINSAMNTDLSHRGHTSAPPQRGFTLDTTFLGFSEKNNNINLTRLLEMGIKGDHIAPPVKFSHESMTTKTGFAKFKY